MAIASMRCPKCGYTQLASPACKSCGVAFGGPQAAQLPPQPQPRSPQPKLENVQIAQPPPQSQSRPSQSQPDSNQTHSLFFHGTGGPLFGIHIVNIFLTLITLVSIISGERSGFEITS